MNELSPRINFYKAIPSAGLLALDLFEDDALHAESLQKRFSQGEDVEQRLQMAIACYRSQVGVDFLERGELRAELTDILSSLAKAGHSTSVLPAG